MDNALIALHILLGHHFYVYSLSMPNAVSYVFSLESKFLIPQIPSLGQRNAPLFLAKMWVLRDLFTEMDVNMRELYEQSMISDSGSSNDHGSRSPSPPQRKNKDRDMMSDVL